MAKLEEEIKQGKPFESEYQKALVNLIFTHHYLLNKSQQILKPFDLTSQQYNVLRILRGSHPNSLSLMSIKERMLDKMSDTSRLVERLRKKGLVNRVTSPEDRRKVEISISNQGLELLAEMEPAVKGMHSLLANLSEGAVTTLNDLLDRIRDCTF